MFKKYYYLEIERFTKINTKQGDSFLVVSIYPWQNLIKKINISLLGLENKYSCFSYLKKIHKI